MLALAWLAMAAKHDAGSLRGLSRWALAFVMRGRAPNGSAGKQKAIEARQDEKELENAAATDAVAATTLDVKV